MAKPLVTTIDRFDGGMVNDPRDRREATARVVTNFDIYTNPYKLSPYRESEDGDSSGGTSFKRNFAVTRRTGTTHSLYALGLQSGANDAEILYKDLSTGGANDLDDAGWSTPSNNQGGNTTTQFQVFIEYRNQDEIYYLTNSRYISAFSPTGSAIIDQEADLTAFTNAAEGLVHSKDDICYIPYDNKIASKNGAAAFTVAALTLPAHFRVSSIAEYGNYLAIGCAPLSGQGNSRVYLWDRDSSLTTLSESIDWGSGELQVLETVGGELLGISHAGTGSDRVGTDKMIFRRYIPGNPDAKEITSLIGEAATGDLPNVKQKVDDRLFFMMNLTLNGAVRTGTWSFGLSKTVPGYTIVHERTPNNDTLTSFTLRNFIFVGEYLFQAGVESGTHDVKKTSDTSTAFSATAIYESKIFNTGDSSLKKDLIGFSVMTEFLPSAGQVVAQYAINENIGQASWTNILTETTDNAISSSDVAGLPKDYKEIQFRLQSTGGAEITGFTFQEEITGKRPY